MSHLVFRRISVFLIAIATVLTLISCQTEKEEISDTEIAAELSEKYAEERKAEQQSYEKYPDFISPVVHNGLDIYVSPTKADEAFSSGEDTTLDRPLYDGSFEHPFNSLKVALLCANPGDTIYLLGGTYDEKNYISKRGTPDAWYTIKAYGDEEVIFDDGKGTLDSCIVFEEAAGYWKVEGFEIRNYTGAGIWIKGGTNYCIENMSIHDISNPSFTNYGSSAILGSGENVLVRNCSIYDIGQDRMAHLDHGFYLGSPHHWVIDSNLIYNVPGAGIHQYCGDSPQVEGQNVYVWNNIIYNCNYGFVLSSCAKYYVSNNTVVDSAECDFFIYGLAKDCVIQNNIFYTDFTETSFVYRGQWDKNNIRKHSPGAHFIIPNGNACSNMLYENNLLFGEVKRKDYYSGGVGQPVNGFQRIDGKNTHKDYITSSPCFSGEGNFGFIPGGDSPCIGTALINEYTPPTNYDGVPRSEQNNIGAY